MIKVHLEATEEKFLKYPSVSKAQQIESLVEGVSIDYGHYASVSGKVHKELLEDNKPL